MSRSRRFRVSGWESLEGRDLPSAGGIPFGFPPPTQALLATDPYSTGRLASNLQRTELGKNDIVFLGDSILDFWTTRGAASWASSMASRGAVDFAIGGSTTGNLLAQIATGELLGNPRVVVMMIGTNNILRGNSAARAAEGVAADVAAVRSMLPQAKVLLLSVLPINSPYNQAATALNSLIARLHDGAHVHFANVSTDFLLPNGSPNAALYADKYHPNAQGYSILARLVGAHLDLLT